MWTRLSFGRGRLPSDPVAARLVLHDARTPRRAPPRCGPHRSRDGAGEDVRPPVGRARTRTRCCVSRPKPPGRSSAPQQASEVVAGAARFRGSPRGAASLLGAHALAWSARLAVGCSHAPPSVPEMICVLAARGGPRQRAVE
eukprot:scaffold1127_cov361-Prasinococcus_capsulatus_cf.AAC.19